MSRLTQIRAVEVPEDGAPVQAGDPSTAAAQQQVATEMLFTALRALSQRTLVALANLFTLLTVASAFYLWVVALPNVSILQIVALSIYSIFVLLVNMYGRRA